MLSVFFAVWTSTPMVQSHGGLRTLMWEQESRQWHPTLLRAVAFLAATHLQIPVSPRNVLDEAVRIIVLLNLPLRAYLLTILCDRMRSTQKTQRLPSTVQWLSRGKVLVFLGWDLNQPPFHGASFWLERQPDRQSRIHIWVFGRHFLKNKQNEPAASKRTANLGKLVSDTVNLTASWCLQTFLMKLVVLAIWVFFFNVDNKCYLMV